MDILSDLCRSIRLEGSIFYFADLSAPWRIALPVAKEPKHSHAAGKRMQPCGHDRPVPYERAPIAMGVNHV